MRTQWHSLLFIGRSKVRPRKWYTRHLDRGAQGRHNVLAPLCYLPIKFHTYYSMEYVMSFLFHKTGYLHMMNFLVYGGIKTSDLYLNQTERDVVAGYIRGYEKFLYYMSFARSRHSEYIETGDLDILIQFDRNKIRNFGKLRPFHYHNINNRIHGYNDKCNVMKWKTGYLPTNRFSHCHQSNMLKFRGISTCNTGQRRSAIFKLSFPN